MALTKKSFLAGAAVGVGLTAAVAVGAGVQMQMASAQQAIQPVAPPGAMAPTGAPMSFANIIERVAPAVVSIQVTTHLPQQRTMQIPGLPFQFNVPPGAGGDDQDSGPDAGGDDSDGPSAATPKTPGAHAKKPRGPEAMAAGSGFFISADGYLVTNNHVIENADTIKVTLTDQRELTARLIGRDPVTDLAVLKVDGGNFPFVNFEAQAKPRVGDWVIAIGNPYLLGGTVTAGIVSSEGRNIPGEQNIVPYLQIDAPINRGNSGGPTFDVFGRVIGVNTAIYSENGGSVGIGFAIPASTASGIVRDLIAHGHVSHGYLGITIQDVTPDIAASEGIEARHGALVGDVVAGGPGGAAGLQPGDIITSVNGKAVNSKEELTQITAMSQPGDALHIDLLRAGRKMSVTAKAGTRPSPAELAENGGMGAAPGEAPGEMAVTKVLGLSLSPLTEALRQQFGVQPSVRGVVVTKVAQDSDAAQNGLRPGMVIVRAGDHTVSTPADVTAAIAEARRAHRPSVLLLINIGGRTAFFVLKLDGADAGSR
ncbi:MAG: Do family serine endopeptidase [Caulobacteraceae bacterium]